MNKSNSKVNGNRQRQRVQPRSLPRAPVSNGGSAQVKPVAPDAVQQAPVSFSQVQGPSRPQISSSVSRQGDLRVRVRHREYVQDITGLSSTDFAVIAFLAINPGLARLFPWLSALANNFESYRFNMLRFEYRTQISTASSGKLLMAVDYDASDPQPTSKQAMMTERTKADCAVWQMINMECDRLDLDKLPQRYVRNGTVTSTDVKMYDVGSLVLAANNTNAQIGELWVSYDIELITPAIAPSPASLNITGGGTISDAALYGTAPVLTGSLSVSVNSTGTTLTFNVAGQYLLELKKTGTGLAATVLTGTATSAAAAAFIVNAAGTDSLESFLITVNTAGRTVIFNSTADTTTTASVARIAQYAAANA